MVNLTTADDEVLREAEQCKLAANELAILNAEQRAKSVLFAAEEIEHNKQDILDANAKDITEAERLVSEGQLSPSLLSRLKLDESRLSSITQGMRQVACLADPLGQTTLARELDNGLNLYRLSCPIGLIAVIFESRPDALPQIASLCLKSGNSVILKGGREAVNTNAALFRCIRNGAIKAGVPEKAVLLLDSRKAVIELLKADQFVDLVIPRGSNQLVSYIQSNTRIPVLGHAEGVCHIYVDESADIAKSVQIVTDSKVQYPSACNAVETLLLHTAVAKSFLSKCLPALTHLGVEIRCDERAAAVLAPGLASAVKPSVAEDWRTEYCDLILSIKVVDSLDEAIVHINKFGSHHTDCIATEDKSAFDRFFAQVNSAGVYWNASTRFADGFRYGFGAEVGISTGKLHPRGPVGLEGLVTYKYKLEGNGHIVADYVGVDAKRFTHKSLGSDGTSC